MELIQPGTAAEWEQVRELVPGILGFLRFQPVLSEFRRGSGRAAGRVCSARRSARSGTGGWRGGRVRRAAPLRCATRRGQAPVRASRSSAVSGVGRALLGWVIAEARSDGVSRDGRRHDSADVRGARNVRSRRLRAHRAVCGGAYSRSDLSAAEAVKHRSLTVAARSMRRSEPRPSELLLSSVATNSFTARRTEGVSSSPVSKKRPGMV